MNVTELIKRLREKPSRDNRELLDQAADTIEALMKDAAELERLKKLKEDGRLVELPCKPGDDLWWVSDDFETGSGPLHAECVPGGIKGVAITEAGATHILNEDNEISKIGGPFGCLSKEQAEELIKQYGEKVYEAV